MNIAPVPASWANELDSAEALDDADETSLLTGRTRRARYLLELDRLLAPALLQVHIG
jgi:hypothetical protein